MMKNLLILCLAIFAAISSFAQSEVGTWKSHLPMNNFLWTGELQEKFVFGNNFGILLRDKEDESIEDLTKINILSETGISSMRCSFSHDLCVIGYRNGNIDILEGGNAIINQPAILNSPLIGDKEIYDIIFRDDIAYLFCGLGIIQLDLSTYNILERAAVSSGGLNLIPTCGLIHKSTIYFASEGGIFFDNVQELFVEPTLTQIGFNGDASQIKQIFAVEDQLFFTVVNDSFRLDYIYELVGNDLIETEWMANSELRHVHVGSNDVIISAYDAIERHSFNQEFLEHIFTYGGNYIGVNANMALPVNTGEEIIIADGDHGGVISTFENPYNSTVFGISSPKSGGIFSVFSIGEEIIALDGGNEFTFNPPWFHSLKDGEWETQLLQPDGGMGVRNPVMVTEADDKRFVALDGSGLIELNAQNQVRTLYNEFNSEIEDRSEFDADYYGITAAQSDSKDNVWLLNSLSNHPLKVFRKNGDWVLIDFEQFNSPITKDLRVLSTDLVVFTLKNEGLIIYDPNGTPGNIADDRYVQITSSPSQGNLPSDNVLSFVEDKSGELWIGTDAGIGIIYQPENAFSSSFEGVQKIIVTQDGFNGYLFESDAIAAMAVDGANRKWVGATGAGLFLISEEGQEQLLRFTEEDDPLLSNEITGIAIQPTTGEVFVATDKGLQSFRSDATDPSEQLDELVIFPNPVKPGFDGVISINGLAEESRVRITDSSGNLVYETVSRGGTATWNGNTAGGDRVNSGVYLVFASSVESDNGSLGKILFLN